MGLSLVHFKAKWSGACQIIEPLYNELAKSYKGVVHFYSIDVEKMNGLEKEYGVLDFPTILFFKIRKSDRLFPGFGNTLFWFGLSACRRNFIFVWRKQQLAWPCVDADELLAGTGFAQIERIPQRRIAC